MNEETQVAQTETAPETTEEKQAEKTVDDTAVQSEKSKELETALAQKAHFREKAEKAEAERKVLEKKLNDTLKQGSKSSLDVGDYIDISASLDGLDQREKEKLAREHKLSGRPLSEIRKDEDFVLWQTAYRNKVEKENKNLTPTTTQAESQRPKSLVEKLREAKNMDEKEALLKDAGLVSQRARRNPAAGKFKLG